VKARTAALPAAVKRLAHAGSVSYGRITSGGRMLPNFLICGGQRCGTTSLYRALAAHPAVVKAVLHKGVHYFDTDYHRGLNWYRAHFPLRATAAAIETRVGVPAQTFESSPYYMYHPHAAARIARDLPGARLIVLVRDPVERAYSQHAHEVARGFETERDFARALALEPSRVDGEVARMLSDPTYHSFSHQHHAYRARGEYITHLRRLADLIGRDRLHVVEAERFFTRPEECYDEVLDFLGLPRLGYPPFERHNARPRAAAMPAALRAELREHYRPHDEQLCAFLGREVSWSR
jgi:hypothetical protein